MKRNTIKIVQRLISVFKVFSLNILLIGLAVICGIETAEAQEISKSFSREITVSPDVTVISKGPLHLNFEMNGRIAMDWNERFYQIIPGGNDGVSALLVRDYEIFTWDKNTIKQDVEISILPSDDAPMEAKQLMENLKLEIVENAGGEIKIDDNLNIQKFGFTNGFLKKNTNRITLENGSSYRMKGITIKSTLHIPKTSDLELSSKYLAIALGDLEGKLKLDLFKGEISAGNIGELEANLDFCKANFKELGSVIVNCKKTNFIAESIETLRVGSNDLAGQSIYKCNLDGRGAKSSLSKYSIQSVKDMDISETTNDNFNIYRVGKLKANYSTFSNYEIGRLDESFRLNAKNGDLRIDEVADGFKEIDLDNHISSIDLNMKDNSNYKIQLRQNEYTELDFSDSIQQLKKGGSDVYLKGEEATAGKIAISCDSCKVKIED